MVQHFLQSDHQTQLDYVRYGLNLLEDGVNGSLGELVDQVDRDQAQDRIFLGSVQSVTTALETILSDPGETPTALASLATDPANILTLVTLMIATAFAAQISAFTLFGDPESSSNRGVVGLVLDILAGAQSDMGMGDGGEGMEDGDMEGEDGDMDGEDAGMEEEVGEMEDTSETEDSEEEEEEMDNMDESDDMEDEDGSRVGLIEAVINFITGLFSGNDMSEDGDNMEGSEDMSESEEEGSDMDDERQEDTMEDGASDGGSSFGGISASLHPIDLAALFVQVQEAIGMNCTCAEGAMTEEMITDATARLMEEEQMKNKFKKVLNKTEKKKNKKDLKNKKEKLDIRKRVPKTA